MIAIPPFRAEFGIMIRFHAVAVRAMERPILVAHEPGLEALYPDCDRVIVDQRNDSDRRWTYLHDPDFVEGWKDRFIEHTTLLPDKHNPLPIQPFLPEPFERQRGNEPSGIVVCPRRRDYGKEKNWDSWPLITNRLRESGSHVFAAGLKDTSYPVAADECAWDYDRPLDATIEAMRNCSLVVATASGLSLLALLCGARLLLVASGGGKIAPGPTRNGEGKIQHDKYWRIPVNHYYRPLNHLRVGISVVNGGWEHEKDVLRFIERHPFRVPTHRSEEHTSELQSR